MDDLPTVSGEVREKLKDYSDKLKHKVDTDNLRTMLREKCKVRMREARQKRYDFSRGSPMQTDDDEAAKSVIAGAIIAELRELNANLILEREIMDEFFAESFEWAAKELEKEMDYYSSFADVSNYIICPTCLMGDLILENQQLSCTCGLQFAYDGTPKEFRAIMEKVFAAHRTNCPKELIFYADPTETGRKVLCAVCNDCEYIYQV